MASTVLSAPNWFETDQGDGGGCLHKLTRRLVYSPYYTKSFKQFVRNVFEKVKNNRNKSVVYSRKNYILKTNKFTILLKKEGNNEFQIEKRKSWLKNMYYDTCLVILFQRILERNRVMWLTNCEWHQWHLLTYFWTWQLTEKDSARNTCTKFFQIYL